MDTQTSEKPQAQVIEAKALMSVTDQQRLDERFAKESDYYAIFLMDEVTGDRVRVRTSVWELDEDRVPILKDGKRQLRNPHDVALDVWAAQGADDHTLEMVQRGGCIVATPRSIANEIAMRNAADAE